MKKFPIILLICLFNIVPIWAKDQFIYKQISRKEGFTSTVNCIYKEQDGEVWLGTPNGLYNFNGYNLRHLEDSLVQGKKVFCIKEDKEDNIWILTDDWPVYRKKGEESFRKATPAQEDDALESRPFQSICQDEEGVWLGSNGKLFYFNYEDDSLRLFTDMKDRSSFLFRDILMIDENTLFCTSHNGIILIDTNTGEVKDQTFKSSREVSSALIDSRGNIWLAFYNRGIEVYNREGKLLKRFNTDNSNLSNDIVLCMTERYGQIWVGTDGGGINILSLETDDVTVLSHISGDSSSFPAHSIMSIYTDSYGNIWAGSIREGLIYIGSSEMKTYSDAQIGMNTGLSNPTVLFLHQDNSSRYIWIGTDAEGLNRFDPVTREFTHYPSTLKSKIVSIADYSEDELILSLYADRIAIFNKNTGKIRTLEIKDRDLNYMIRYAGRSVNAVNEHDGNILLICNTINRLDSSTGECTLIHKGGSENIYVIGKTADGIWLHDFHNIYILRTGASSLELKGKLDECIIRGGDICNRGVVWLATEKGLYNFEPKNGRFTHIETSLFTEATTAICDKHSRIWVGTEHDIYAYLTESDSFAIFGESDGASPNEYLSKPRLFSREGDIYLGGVQGLLCISKEFSIEAKEIPRLELYKMRVDGNTVEEGKRGVYVIPRHSKMINISLSVKEKDIFRNKMFSFAFSKGGPTFETDSPSLDIQHLPKAGKYDITVSCTKRNGDWTKPYRIATIYIPRPWYFSGWFLGSISLLLIIIISTSILYSTHRKANKLQLSLKEQEQRVYEEKVKMLINISHELRTPLTLIMAPLKRLITKMSPDDRDFNTLGRVYRQSRRMRDLLNMVLELRKMEVGKSTLNIERVEFNKWITDSIEDIVAEELSENIRIVTNLDPKVNTADIDKRKCSTILMNILINAVKHSSAGDKITISTILTENGMVRISISDQGPGLRDIDPAKMFTRFYQSNHEQYGSGIGLSYSKILVEMHKGNIGAKNNPDKGATFWWEIPVVSDIKDKVAPKAYLNELLGYNPEDDIEIPASSDTDTSQKTLMIVDDSTDLLDFLRESLDDEFLEIITVTSGNKALKILAEEKLPDIIVSDVNMPDGDGYSLCKEIKGNQKYSHIPVVMLTARGEEQSQTDSYRLDADAFMAKPFEIETILELLRSLLRRKEEIRKKYLDTNDEVIADYGSNEESFIIQLNRIIAEHISDPGLDQQLICKELGVSRALLYNRMKTITGSGTKDYITRIRLEKAKSLIETTRLPIIEISEMTGFTSQSYFSTAFKAYTGMTPSQYKKQNK